MSDFYNSYIVLNDVIREGAYANISLFKQSFSNQAKVTKIVYGVIENYFYINAIIDNLIKRSTKGKIRVVLMIAIYSILFLDTPHYASVNEGVNLAKDIGQASSAGFVNAILNKVVKSEYSINKQSPQYKYNLPKWLFDEIKTQYKDNYEKILEPELNDCIDFRISEIIDTNVFSDEERKELAKYIKEAKYSKNDYTYSAKLDDSLRELAVKGIIAYQSMGSQIIAKACGDVKDKDVLDACAAPGGKAVYLSEKGARVTALDIHEHRVSLIEKYGIKSRVNLTALVEDASVYNDQRDSMYDIVLVDAPCSGTGVISKRKDIVLNIKKEDISSLAKIQSAILNNCSKYVKIGGHLVYSTCSILIQENEYQVKDFLSNNKNFALEVIPILLIDQIENNGTIKLIPKINSNEGFFVARFIRLF